MSASSTKSTPPRFISNLLQELYRGSPAGAFCCAIDYHRFVVVSEGFRWCSGWDHNIARDHLYMFVSECDQRLEAHVESGMQSGLLWMRSDILSDVSNFRYMCEEALVGPWHRLSHLLMLKSARSYLVTPSMMVRYTTMTLSSCVTPRAISTNCHNELWAAVGPLYRRCLLLPFPSS